MNKLKKQINSILAILMVVGGLNLTSIKAIEQNQNTLPVETETTIKSVAESAQEDKSETSTDANVKTSTNDETVDSDKNISDDPSLIEHLGNEPPKESKEETNTPRIVFKNEDSSYTDINTNEKISADRGQIKMVTPLELLDVEIWVKSETDGTYTLKKVSELSEYEKNKYAFEIEQASKPITFIGRSSVNISIGNYTGYSINVTAADGKHNDWSNNYQILLIDGEPGFCVQPGFALAPGSNFTPSDYEQRELSIIAYEGWELSSKTNEDYLATQLMMWEALGGTINSTSFSAYVTYRANIQEKIDHHFDRPSFKNEVYEINVGETITITDTNNILNKFNIVSTDGLEVKINGNNLLITGTLNAKDDASITLNKFASEFIGTSIAYSKPGSQTAAKFKLYDPLIVKLTIKVNKFGSLLITKNDEEGYKVANTSFLVSRNADMSSPLGTYTTGSDGTVKVENILPGTVYVQETSVPSPLIIDNSIKKVVIEPNETASLSVTNKYARGSLSLNKVDSVTGSAQGDATFEGAVYGLYAQNNIIHPGSGNVIYAKDTLISRMTIINGKASINNLYLGDYYVKELGAPKGYTLDPTSYVVSLNYVDQNTVNINKEQTVKERVKAQAFEIIKIASGVTTDPSDVPTLAGAEFTIKLKSQVDLLGWDSTPIAKNAQGITASILVTDNKGYALSDELPYGVYVLRETKTPVNHETVPDFNITVKDDSRTPQSWRILNDKPFEAMLKVVKYDSETGEAISLSNATFKIKDLQTGEYLKQWIYYPIPHQIDEFTTSSDGSFTTPTLMMYGKYQLEEIKTPDGYLTLKDPVQFEIGDAIQVEPSPDGKTPVIKVEVPNDPIKGQISVKKEAEVFKGYDFRQTEHGLIYEPIFEKGLLAGVNYQITAAEDIITNDKTLWYSKGDIVDDFVTTADAEYLSALLPLGEYNLQEIATAEGYVLDDTIYHISSTAEDNTTSIILHTEEKWNDKERGSISFEKTLEKSAYIDAEDAYKDISFGLFAEEPIIVAGEEVVPADGLLGVIGLNADLQGTFGLDFAGKYYIKELTTNDHYILDDTKYSFEYVYNNETLTEIKLDKEIENKLKRGSIELHKVDNESKIALAGAEFVLSDTEEFKEILQTGVTNEAGTLKFDDLEMNTYFIKESKRPVGFELDPTVHKIEINEDGQIITLKLENTKIRGSFDIIKTSNEPYPFIQDSTKIPEYLESIKDSNSTANEGQKFYLEDVEFIVAKDKEFKEIIQTGTTDENGKLSFKDLTEGKYYWKESKCLEGFVLDTTVHEIVITENGQHETYDLQNIVRRSWIEVYKEDEFTKRKLPNAEFTLYDDPECTIELSKTISGEDGIAMFKNLLNGTYYFKETNAPEGFILSEEIVKVVIDTNTPPKAYKIVYYNTMLPSYSVPKTGTQDSNFNLFLGMFVISCGCIVFFNRKYHQKKGTERSEE